MHVRHETIAAKENHRQMQLLISTKQKTKYESMRRKNAIVKKQKKKQTKCIAQQINERMQLTSSKNRIKVLEHYL